MLLRLGGPREPRGLLTGVNVDGASVPVQDPDQNEHFTWTIVENDEDAFNISAATGDISTRAGLNYEYRTSYLIKVSRESARAPRARRASRARPA